MREFDLTMITPPFEMAEQFEGEDLECCRDLHIASSHLGY